MSRAQGCAGVTIRVFFYTRFEHIKVLQLTLWMPEQVAVI